MSEYPDSGDMDQGRLRHQWAKEETPGTLVEPRHVGYRCIDMVLFGEPGPERLEIPDGASVIPTPHLHTWRCEGPNCESFVIEALRTAIRPAGWYSVMHRAETGEYSLRYFCSLMCMANWLAGELAKEEHESRKPGPTA